MSGRGVGATSDLRMNAAIARAGAGDRPMARAAAAARKAPLPLLLFALCLAGQLYLVFVKSFNWDEFLHFSEVYETRAGTLTDSLQVLHARLLWWAPYVAHNLIDQMRAARLFMWGLDLIVLALIYGTARKFTGRGNALFAAFAYLTAGYVFTQGFAIRADPIAAATLMAALFLLTRDKLDLRSSLMAGVLIGIAGMATVKSIFYAPCFAGILWLKFHETEDPKTFLRNVAALAVAAPASFAAIYFYHVSQLASIAQPLPHTSRAAFYLRWFTDELPYGRYILLEMILAPVFVLAVALAPLGWKRGGLDRLHRIALAGFLLPLASLLLYRNTFPYFFVFLLPPVAVAIAPAIGLIRARIGDSVLATALTLMPLVLFASEPKDVIDRQRALIDYVHRDFPEKTGYLGYAGMISDYPRIFKHLTSGNGIRSYNGRRDPVVAREIAAGNVPFIIANHPVISGALAGQPEPATFLPEDLAAMRGNYVQQWGVLWREGEAIPAGPADLVFDVPRAGDFVFDGDGATIDGTPVARGERLHLAEGKHIAGGGRSRPATLWRGTRLPSPPPPGPPVTEVFTNF